ncbi:hypothetical protein GTI81_09060 [Enterococcus faecalis]|uniref:Uncharacterized protein n=1 Tax=Enterococcus faecalis TaxID=1351 RepID=A0AAP6RHD6_ENTFL|nr:hypothetical protein [Enterococcus faecalis]MXS28380.1 hypothetical protein [Enterococcus faecalis]MXS52859.1 hypothetical protein [Enterococcus faecalis]
MPPERKSVYEKDEELFRTKCIIEERERIIDELLAENVDLRIIQKVTKFYKSGIIKRKIKLLEKQLEIEQKKEIEHS